MVILKWTPEGPLWWSMRRNPPISVGTRPPILCRAGEGIRDLIQAQKLLIEPLWQAGLRC